MEFTAIGCECVTTTSIPELSSDGYLSRSKMGSWIFLIFYIYVVMTDLYAWLVPIVFPIFFYELRWLLLSASVASSVVSILYRVNDPYHLYRNGYTISGIAAMKETLYGIALFVSYNKDHIYEIAFFVMCSLQMGLLMVMSYAIITDTRRYEEGDGVEKGFIGKSSDFSVDKQ